MTILLFLNLVGVSWLIFLHNKSVKETTKRDKELKDWLFVSLYSINKSVKKPAETVTEKSKKAIVVSPTEDPMSEFSGLRSDFYE